MARPLRVDFPGALYHVTSRGDRREAIYLDDADRHTWLDLLGQVCQRFNWVCHAYCLMDNHFHIVVEPVEGNLSAGMRQLNGVYTQWHNREHEGQVLHCDITSSQSSDKAHLQPMHPSEPRGGSGWNG